MDKIVCLGKNYLEHAKELGDAVPEKPVIFLKPPSVLKSAKAGECLPAGIPDGLGSVHHECEIVLRLSEGGYRMSLDEAGRAIGSVTLGLDMTLRDKQALLKKAGHPWTVAKVFPDSAIVGPFVSVSDFPDWLDTEFTFAVDGQVRQRGKGTQMMLAPVEAIQYVSQCFPLVAGDLVFTGTPHGVNAIVGGQVAMLQWGRLTYSVAWKAF